MRAEIVPEFFGTTGDHQIDIQPRIAGVETIELEARDALFPQTPGAPQDTTVVYDAKRTFGVRKIGSYFSDGDLVIENLTTLAADGKTVRNTKDMTITMDHTDNFNSDTDASDLTVYFDEDYLVSGKSVQSKAIFYLLDQDADMNNTDVDGDGNVDLLAHINTNGLRFTIDGGPVKVISFDKQNLLNNQILSHQDFVDALQDSLAALKAAGEVPADTVLKLDPSIPRQTFLDDGTVSSAIPAIVLESQSTTGLKSVGFLWVEDLSGDFNVYGRMAEADPQKCWSWRRRCRAV